MNTGRACLLLLFAITAAFGNMDIDAAENLKADTSKNNGSSGTTANPDSGIHKGDQGATAQPSKSYWLNTQTGVRHNSGCRYYGKAKNGRMCGSEEGKACGICGG